MKTITITINESSQASAPFTGTSTASQLLAKLLGGTVPTTPTLPIPFSHRGIALGDWVALEAATMPVEAEDRAEYDSLAPLDQPQKWVDIVDKQFRRMED